LGGCFTATALYLLGFGHPLSGDHIIGKDVRVIAEDIDRALVDAEHSLPNQIGIELALNVVLKAGRPQRRPEPKAPF
jgi:hypothetical protein